MKHWHFLTYCVAFCVMMPALIGVAQQQTGNTSPAPYEPAVPPPSTVTAYGANPYWGGGSTPAGSAMTGMANVISAKGNYNLSTSAAAVNMTQAQRNEIQNHQTYENTYFQMRQTNEAYRKAERGPPPTREQLARLARDGDPKPVSASEVNPVNGKVHWPDMLQEDSFAAGRGDLEQLLAKKAAHGSLSVSDKTAARKTIELMFAELKSQIKDVPPQEYVASRNFLRSMIYETTHSDL